MFDYEPFPSPEALVRDVDIAIVASVEEVRGVTVDRGGPEVTGGVLVVLAPAEIWKDGLPRSRNDVYLLLPRPSNVPLDPYRTSLPPGTRVSLSAYRATVQLIDGGPGDVVFEAAPQGLMFELADGTLLDVWGSHESEQFADWQGIDSIDELRSAVHTQG